MAAVIVLAAFIHGLRNSVDASIEPVANNITITPLRPQVPGGLDAEPLTGHDATVLTNCRHRVDHAVGDRFYDRPGRPPTSPKRKPGPESGSR